MFYLHLLIGLISSKKYLMVAKMLVPVLKRVIPANFFHIKSLQKSKKRRKIKFYKNAKN